MDSLAISHPPGFFSASSHSIFEDRWALFTCTLSTNHPVYSVRDPYGAACCLMELFLGPLIPRLEKDCCHSHHLGLSSKLLLSLIAWFYVCSWEPHASPFRSSLQTRHPSRGGLTSIEGFIPISWFPPGFTVLLHFARFMTHVHTFSTFSVI